MRHPGRAGGLPIFNYQLSVRDIPGKLWYTSSMIKDAEILKKFEHNFISGEGHLPYAQSRKIFTAMWQEGVTLGVLPSVEPLAGIEVDIRVARILNTCLTKPLPV
jgi:hypothetical protein